MDALSAPAPASASAAQAAGLQDRRPRTAQEAAEQFEAVLVRQFVQTMTKDLFKGSLAGEGALAGGQADLQRDVLTDALTDHLVHSGTLRLRDLLLRQWNQKPAPPTP